MILVKNGFKTAFREEKTRFDKIIGILHRAQGSCCRSARTNLDHDTTAAAPTCTTTVIGM